MTRSGIPTVLLTILVLLGVAPVAFAHYETTTGRWLERDSIGTRPSGRSGVLRTAEQYGDGSNLYQYVRSNPRRYVDPRGWQSQDVDGGAPVDQAAANPTPDGIPQCKDKNGNPVSLTFDGNSLKGNGFCAVAVSGRDPDISVYVTLTMDGIYTEKTWTFDYSAPRQLLRSEGPLPQGCYFIRSDHEDSADGANNPKGQSSFRHKYWPWTDAWGDYSWPLFPYPATNTNDSTGNPRSGFFVHGGLAPGSAGCIDLCNDSDTALHEFMDEIRKINGGPCFVQICAQYDPNETSIVAKRFDPLMQCAPRCTSVSPIMEK